MITKNDFKAAILKMEIDIPSPAEITFKVQYALQWLLDCINASDFTYYDQNFLMDANTIGVEEYDFECWYAPAIQEALNEFDIKADARINPSYSKTELVIPVSALVSSVPNYFKLKNLE